MVLKLHYLVLALAQCAITFSVAKISILVPERSLRGGVNFFQRKLQTNSTVLKLINAGTDTAITDISQNLVVQLGSISPKNLTIQVVVTGFTPAPKSVKITLVGPVNRTAIESGTYALCGNNGSDFNPCTNVAYGRYNVKAELYTLKGALGTLMSTTAYDFELRNMTVPSPVMPPVMPPVQSPTSEPAQTCSIPRVS
jgi:hypothetical protein